MGIIFLSISFQAKASFKSAIAAMQGVAKDYGHDLLVFVEKYKFGPGEEKIMMQQACSDISSASIVFAEVSYRAVGVGIEVGYAIGIGKPVVYLRRADAAYSKTIGGIVDTHLIYSSIDDLSHKLNIFFKTFKNAIIH